MAAVREAASPLTVRPGDGGDNHDDDNHHHANDGDDGNDQVGSPEGHSNHDSNESQKQAAENNSNDAEQPATGDELDQPGFEPEAYVDNLVRRHGLKTVTTTAKELVDGISSLDSGRRALVYDNYSKLITATDTMLAMRTRIEPLAPATSTLAPTLAHVADTAAAIAGAMRDQTASPSSSSAAQDQHDGHGRDRDDDKKRAQRQTVRYALATPARLRARRAAGDEAGADADWADIRVLLDQWGSAEGVDRLRAECEEAISRR